MGQFTPEHPILGIADIADELGMSHSTTHRYFITLVALGYLEQVKARKYRLTLPVIDLGMSAMSNIGIREHSRPLLHELRLRTGYTTSLTVLDGTDILYLERSPSSRRGQRKVDQGLAIGSRLPVYCTAMGKLLLAYLYPEAQHDLLDNLKLSKRGPNTIRSKKVLRQELETIREVGLAVSDEELAPDLIAIAAPVRCESGEVIAAINLAANKEVIGTEKLVSELAPHLITTADRISTRMGYRREDEPHSGNNRLYQINFER